MDTTAHTLQAALKKSVIPEYMHDGIIAWILFGRRPGNFLTAILENNLLEAARRADNQNGPALQAWVRFLDSYAPSVSYGSPARVDAWEDRRGLRGPEARLVSVEVEHAANQDPNTQDDS